MDSNYLQRLRFQLQKRYRRLNSCGYLLFHSALVQYWNYLQAQPLTGGVLARLDAETLKHEGAVEALVKRREIEEFGDERAHIAFVYRVIQHCVRQPLGNGVGPEVMIGHSLCNESRHDDALNSFREVFLEPFYEFLDDALDQQGAVLSLLIKYKRKVEWFEREAVASSAAGDERTLAKHLYAYLFDQGLDFQIEPHSVSGEADLVATDLILDAKVFDGARRGVSYLASGVHQVHTYARDFNQDVGYLVAYKTCPENIDFAFSTGGQLVPHVVAGGKTIYVLVIDICIHDASASKRGVLKVHTVSSDVLVQTIPSEVNVGHASESSAPADQ